MLGCIRAEDVLFADRAVVVGAKVFIDRIFRCCVIDHLVLKSAERITSYDWGLDRRIDRRLVDLASRLPIR